MIELKNISKTFNKNTANEVSALQNIQLTIADGDFMIVVGTNGSGKTTLLNVIAGTIETDDGVILVDAKDITRLKDFQRSRWISRIFQNPLMGTAPELTILENFRLASLRTQSKKLTVGATEKFGNQVKDKIASLNLGLENNLNQLMGTLSGGQRQALSLLMAVMGETKILLMDEPTASLDPKTSELVLTVADKIIKDYKLTTLFVTHHLKDASRFGNRVILMQEGKIVKDVGEKEKSTLQPADLFQWYEAVS
jgi:putative ABC transport system ATP-binding protein